MRLIIAVVISVIYWMIAPTAAGAPRHTALREAQNMCGANRGAL